MDDKIKQLVDWMTEQKEKASQEEVRDSERNFKHSECYWGGVKNAFSDAIKEVGEIFGN